MRHLFNINPITAKRFRRFRQKRRAWISLWIMLLLYAVSLASECLCNDRPLWVRYNGRNYFPVWRFYPEDTFLHNGRQTRTDYKHLATLPQFTDNPDNRILFPLVPFGPYECLSADSIPDNAWASVTLTPEQRAGTLQLKSGTLITRATDCGFFFDTDDESIPGLVLTNLWILPESLHSAIAARLDNQPAPRISEVITHRTKPDTTALLTLSTFTPRDTPPKSVRVTLQEIFAKPDMTATHRLFFDPTGLLQKGNSAFFAALPTDLQNSLRRLATHSLTTTITDQTMTIHGTRYTVRAAPNTIQWPYPPTRDHWLGIDSSGRDVLARILYGLRTSMTFGFLLVLGAMILGTLAGAVQGYFAGVIDLAMQRLIEIWSALPFLYIMILIGSVYGRGLILLLICYGLFNWIGISYYIRAEFLRLRHRPFVDAARCLGLPAHRIMFRHILPNAITPLITFFPFSLVGAIGSLAALDYLGFGLPPPVPSWGELFAQAQTYRWAWWLILYPALALFIVMLLGVFIGEGVRDAFDPKPASHLE